MAICSIGCSSILLGPYSFIITLLLIIYLLIKLIYNNFFNLKENKDRIK